VVDAGVAATCGDADQAHPTRDWRDLAGCPPSVWRADDLPAVTDDASRSLTS
jgi:hypothetical protein